MGIINSTYQSNVIETFQFEVLSGDYTGIYNVKYLEGFKEINLISSRDDETKGFDQYIIGKETELELTRTYDSETYDLLFNIYEKYGGEAIILFRWSIKDSDGLVTDLTNDNYKIDLNESVFSLGSGSKKVSYKINIKEDQNKFNNRIESSVDLFSNQNLDDNAITPVVTQEIYLKKNNPTLKNEWFAVDNQYTFNIYNILTENKSLVPIVNVLTESFETPTNNYPSNYFSNSSSIFTANANYEGLTLKVTDLIITIRQDPNDPVLINNFTLYFNISPLLTDAFFEIQSQVVDSGSFLFTEINISNISIEVPNMSIGDKLRIFAVSDDSRLPNSEIFISNNFQYELEVVTPKFAETSESVRLFDAFDQTLKQYTDSSITLNSDVLSLNGRYYENFVNSFSGLRFGKNPDVERRFQTNFLDLFTASSNLMALGYDLRPNELKIEPLEFFFKDVEVIDLRDLNYVREDYVYGQSDELFYNYIKTGYNRFSTEQTEDLENFNTKARLTTPLKTISKKLDIESDLITDIYAITEGINDTSNTTNDRDDEIVLINTVDLASYNDESYYNSVIHKDSGSGQLVLEQYERAWAQDFELTDTLTIDSGLNIGSYTIFSISSFEITISASTFDTGVSSNIISTTRTNITKNRSSEGFTTLYSNGKPVEITANAIHDPIRQLLRHYGWFGSGFNKVETTNNIIVNDYKNNGNVTTQVDPIDFPLEYPDQLILDQNIQLQTLLDNGLKPLFSGNWIEITVTNLDFTQFINILNALRYGVIGDDSDSFGYITIPTPLGAKKVYPFLEEGLSFDRNSNKLNIKGFEKYSE